MVSFNISASFLLRLLWKCHNDYVRPSTTYHHLANKISEDAEERRRYVPCSALSRFRRRHTTIRVDGRQFRVLQIVAIILNNEGFS